MTTVKKAKEKWGKFVTIRPGPSIYSGYSGFLWPWTTVEYVEIVDDLDNPDNRWLKRTNGTYVNYLYPPAGYRYYLLAAPEPKDYIYHVQDGKVRKFVPEAI